MIVDIVPLAALLLALLWAAWMTRPRRRLDTRESMAAYRRAMAALTPHEPGGDRQET